jgi:hypothetical protein
MMREAAIVFACVALCALSACGSPAPPPPPPTKPATPAVPLDDPMLARIEGARAAAREAIHEWGLDKYGDDCSVIYDEKQAWLFDCDLEMNTPPFWTTEQMIERAGVVWTAERTLFTVKLDTRAPPHMTMLRHGSQRRVAMIFAPHYRVFKNGPNGRVRDVERWLAMFVHETFHAHQDFQPRVAARMDRVKHAGPRVLEDRYKVDAAYAAAVERELNVLEGAFASGSDIAPAAAKAALRSWLAIHTTRRAMLDEEMQAIDAHFTFAEGAARLTELTLLAKPAATLLGKLEGRDAEFKGFADTKGKHPVRFYGRSVDPSSYYYDLGAYLGLLLDAARPGWRSEVHERNELLVGEIAAVVTDTP